MSRAAVFLDRDGTLIEHVHHLHRIEDVRLVAGAARAVARIRTSGRLAILATNQSVVGRGLISADGLAEIHDHLQERLRDEGGADAVLDAIYWNPHTPPSDGESLHEDRKPNPGMLAKAAIELGIDMSASWMIGDALTDVGAGRRAGCRGTILVRTGEGGRLDPSEVPEGTFVAEDVGGAVELVLREGDGIATTTVDSHARASDDSTTGARP